MSKTHEIPTHTQDLHKGDTVLHPVNRTRYNVVRVIREWDGLYTLQLQVPGRPVKTYSMVIPGFVWTRIAR